MKNFFAVGVVLLTCAAVDAEEPLIVAHRGASHHAPENTLPAFNLAWKQRADAIEGDFRLTRDGHIVCIHDEDTERVSGRKLIVKDSTLAQLRPLDVGTHRGDEYRGTIIPTIAEVFATIPDKKKIYIEIKCGTEVIPRLLDEIKKSEITSDQIVVISFNPQVIQQIKAKSPQIKALWLSGFKKDKLGRTTPSLKTIFDTLKQTQADGFSSSKDIRDSLVTRVIASGYEYHVWTIDDLDTARHFKKLGTKSITTNVPEQIKKHLVEKPHAETAP